MVQTTEPRVSDVSGQSGVVEYLLGLGKYSYRDGYQYAEEYYRLHQVIRALAQATSVDREREALRYGAQLRQVDRVLAALFVEGARERLATPINAWLHISEELYFRVAVEHGRLMDYVSMNGHFALPANCGHNDPCARYQAFAAYLRTLPEGPTRHGLRLGVLSLFDRTEEDVASGLALCSQLRGQDATLDAMAGARLLLAIERGEITRYDPAYRNLAVQMVAATSRWNLAQALPHLQRLLGATPPRDRDARVLRAHLQQTIEQLSHSR